jgi:hypothetical protein
MNLLDDQKQHTTQNMCSVKISAQNNQKKLVLQEPEIYFCHWLHSKVLTNHTAPICFPEFLVIIKIVTGHPPY